MEQATPITNPRVSVVLTTYNSSRVIRKTLESLLEQTFRDFDLIIVDDCSRDDTAEIIASYGDPRIRLVRNQQNQGISKTRNIGLGLARGEYIAMSDHDDISFPSRLEQQVAFLDSHPDFVMVATTSFMQPRSSNSRPRAITSPYLLHWTLFYRCPLVHSAICVRREAMERAGIRYDATYAYSEDYQIYHQLGRIGKLGMLDEPLVIYVIHQHNTTHSVLDDMYSNGLAFMQAQYQEYLGFQGREEDVQRVWDLCNQNIPARDISDLQRLGAFLVEACQRFIDIQQPGEADRALLWRDAANTWWRAVRMSAEKCGNPALLTAARRTFPTELLGHAGSGFSRSYVLALAQRLRRTLSAWDSLLHR